MAVLIRSYNTIRILCIKCFTSFERQWGVRWCNKCCSVIGWLVSNVADNSLGWWGVQRFVCAQKYVNKYYRSYIAKAGARQVYSYNFVYSYKHYIVEYLTCTIPSSCGDRGTIISCQLQEAAIMISCVNFRSVYVNYFKQISSIFSVPTFICI